MKTKGAKVDVKNLPERLRKFINEYCDWKLLPIDAVAICREAADEIERLRAESRILKKALTDIRTNGTKGAVTIAYNALKQAAEAAREK